MDKNPSSFKNIFHAMFSKRVPAEPVRNSIADWQKIILVFTVLFLVVLGLASMFFLRLNRGEIFTEGRIEAGEEEFLNQKTLDELNSYYKIRQDTITTPAQTAGLIDPSV
jgi:hypothetical protein